MEGVVKSVPCRPRPAAKVIEKQFASVGAGRPTGVPGWIVAFFAIALILSLAALILTALLRQDLDKLGKNQATTSSLRQRFRLASLLTYLTFVVTLIVLCILVINKSSFIRYGLVAAIALLLLLGQAVLLQSAVDDAIIIIEQTKTGRSPAIDLKPATFALALSGVTTVALLVGLVLSITDNRKGNTDDNLFTNVGSIPLPLPAGASMIDRSVTVAAPVEVVETVRTTPLVPVAERTSTVIRPQQPAETRTVVVEKLIPVLPPQPPKTQAAASFDAFLQRLGKPASLAKSVAVPL